MALKIGTLAVDPPVVLGLPMAGVTNVGFRRLCRSYGAGLYVSEMISARAVVEANRKTHEMLRFADDERPRSVQLYAVDPGVAESSISRLIGDYGVDHIDLNFGCPAPKVTRKGGGAARPVHRVLFGAIVRASVAAAGTVPVTVKMRIGVDSARRTFIEAGRIAEDAGVAAVALHARTAEQLYAGSADWNAIGELKAAVRSIPVLGNGDIWEARDVLQMMALTDCDGVVVGRGCLGRPWLFRDLADAFAGRRLADPPTLGGVLDAMSVHARLLCELMGEDRGARDFRKHVGWYLTGFPVGGEARRRLAQISTLAELESGVAGLDRRVPFPAGATRVARCHTHGPRPVALPKGWLDAVDDPRPPVGADDAGPGDNPDISR